MEIEVELNKETNEPNILIKTEDWEEIPPQLHLFIAKIADIRAIMYLH